MSFSHLSIKISFTFSFDDCNNNLIFFQTKNMTVRFKLVMRFTEKEGTRNECNRRSTYSRSTAG